MIGLDFVASLIKHPAVIPFGHGHESSRIIGPLEFCQPQACGGVPEIDTVKSALSKLAFTTQISQTYLGWHLTGYEIQCDGAVANHVSIHPEQHISISVLRSMTYRINLVAESYGIPTKAQARRLAFAIGLTQGHFATCSGI
jgi:hypothetical protein